MSKTKLLWFGDGGFPWGRNWLLDLLPPDSVEIEVYNPHENPDTVNNCIVCTSVTAGNRYIRKLRAQNARYGVILLSDECLTEKMAYLEDPNCVFLARNYAHPLVINNPKTFLFGLGWQNGFEEYADCSKPSSERKYVWGFAGSLKTDRERALETIKFLEPNQTYIFKKFNDPDYLPPEEYAKVLNECMFVPAPCGGASNDSFRIYEALETGAIPVVLKNAKPLIIEPSYWHAIFRGEATLPFIVADSWEDAALRMCTVLESGQIDQVQQSCIDFWQHWKTSWKRMFATALDLLNNPIKS